VPGMLAKLRPPLSICISFFDSFFPAMRDFSSFNIVLVFRLVAQQLPTVPDVSLPVEQLITTGLAGWQMRVAFHVKVTGYKYSYFCSNLLFVHFPIFHYKHHIAKGEGVIERVALHGDDIGQFVRFDAAELAPHAQ
jgi:hypothetical protein